MDIWEKNRAINEWCNKAMRCCNCPLQHIVPADKNCFGDDVPDAEIEMYYAVLNNFKAGE